MLARWVDSHYLNIKMMTMEAPCGTSSTALVTLLAPWIPGLPDPNVADFALGVTPPSLAHPFGTDLLGRDMLARTIYGGRISILVGLVGTLVSLVIGPWRHSGANHYGYEMGSLTFTGDTAREWRVQYVKPFFDHWLKDGPDPHTPPVLTYATGVNKWESSERWPMGTATPIYLAANGAATFERPSETEHYEYVSDPAHPVPFIPRPIDMSDPMQWKYWLVQDQRFVSDRPDVAAWKSAPLDKPVHIMGAPEVDLFASTTGTDSDWVVKLIDVYPNDTPEPASQGAKPTMAGLELPIGIEIFRGRYVKSFAAPAALKAGRVEHYRWTLPNVNHVFLPGHRIMVQVQSSLFPLYDRNPQTYVENIMYARPADYKKATQSIWFGGNSASAVQLPVVR